MSVDTRGTSIQIEASFNIADLSVIEYVDLSVLDGDGNLIVSERVDQSPYCYQGNNADQECNYWDFAQHDLQWDNGTPVKKGLHLPRAVAYTTDG